MVGQVEASIQEALSGLAQGVATLEQQLSEAGTSEAQLNARLEKWTGAVNGASSGSRLEGSQAQSFLAVQARCPLDSVALAVSSQPCVL